MDASNLAKGCKTASMGLAALSSEEKNTALAAMAKSLKANAKEIFAANGTDLERAVKSNLDKALLKRLKFDESKLAEVISGIESLVHLPDPVGKTLAATKLDDGLELYRVSRPMGVIGVIFESRPDALVQIAALCLKSANAVLLKGGSEAASTNQILAKIVHDACVVSKAPNGWLGLLETRDDVEELLKMDKEVDLLIPRGSNSFVQYIMQHTLIPVLGHADGICHLYIDKIADPEMAVKLAVDSKCQYVSVCNAVETILIHKDTAENILPPLAKEFGSRGVKMLGCPATCAIIDVLPASEDDWRTEYLDYVVSIRIVDSMDAAISHINTNGSGHTDVIVTADRQRAETFMDMADTADAFWNCSSRFADGFRFGLGAEVGISTNKLHARGPVGLEGLMTYQWRLVGNGQCVADYVSPGTRSFCHAPLEKDFFSDSGKTA